MFTIADFINEMIKFFPEITTEIEKIKSDYEECDTIIIEDIIMPKVVELLKRNVEFYELKSVFAYFEMIAACADDKLSDVFSVCCLEILGNEKMILERAKQYMGPITTMLQCEADMALGRVDDN
ncbi:MAG: resolvase [Lachnospiraceae bacterium]|nr:resolvase [Lachnospiraceae bacterium]